ncbi:hypothetical protein RE9425_03130 [Prescottella equi]|nr:hypothetical protein RE9425_03130 [Prescottella equi]
MRHLTDEAKKLIDGRKAKVLEREALTLTREAAEVANEVLGGPARDWFGSFERLSDQPNVLDPEETSAMVEFLLLRLRLAIQTGNTSIADRSAKAAEKFGAAAATINDAIADLGSPRTVYLQAGPEVNSAHLRIVRRQKTSTPIPASWTREG